jgi:hypothetical protein
LRHLLRIVGPVALFAGVLSLAACGDDEPANTTSPELPAPEAAPPTPLPPTPTEAKTLTFVDGFAAGAKKASDPDDVLFVYVGRHNPT